MNLRPNVLMHWMLLVRYIDLPTCDDGLALLQYGLNRINRIASNRINRMNDNWYCTSVESDTRIDMGAEQRGHMRRNGGSIALRRVRSTHPRGNSFKSRSVHLGRRRRAKRMSRRCSCKPEQP